MFPEKLDQVKREVLDKSPLLRFFLFLPTQRELVENPQFKSAVQNIDRSLRASLGSDWQARYLPIVRRFDESFKALSIRLSPDQKDDLMIQMLVMGAELGSKNVDLFLDDVQIKLEGLGQLNMLIGIENHDGHRGYDFVEAVMRIGADIRKDHPLSEHLSTADKPINPFDLPDIPDNF